MLEDIVEVQVDDVHEDVVEVQVDDVHEDVVEVQVHDVHEEERLRLTGARQPSRFPYLPRSPDLGPGFGGLLPQPPWAGFAARWCLRRTTSTCSARPTRAVFEARGV